MEIWRERGAKWKVAIAELLNNDKNQ
jgi:hypothetical protein